MHIYYGRSFLKRAAKMPAQQQNKLATLLKILQSDPFHSSLHTKRLSHPLLGLLSFRVARDYRVIFSFIDEDTIQLIDVGHRKDIYR